MNLRIIPVLLMLIFVAGCGFQLRGSNLDELQRSNVYVQSSGANQIAGHVRQQLRYAGVNLIDDAGDADYLISLSDERFERNILSVSPRTGKVQEYELSYQSSLSVTDRNGEKLVNNEPITAARDYVFDDGSVLGNFSQEGVLRNDIARHAASSVLRRLQAVTQ
ncbi:MAG TPA: LPS assembly lipoprotein LptE [Gammaproteobacteria bacterium]|nr:LPS assembly lipoprotein LptE [Gammaproteobacteria bacterium]